MRALYRIFDDEGRLLYIGQSATPTRRLDAHVERQEWRYLIAYTATTWHGDADIDEVERRAIATERPHFNLEHASPIPVARARYDEAEADRLKTVERVMLEVRARGSFTIADIITATGLGKYAVAMVVAPLFRDGTIGRGGDGRYRIGESLRDSSEDCAIALKEVSKYGMLTADCLTEDFGWSHADAKNALDNLVASGQIAISEGLYRALDLYDEPDRTPGRTPLSDTGRTRIGVRPYPDPLTDPTERTA